MNKYGVIYKITNKINNKVYIGQTIRKNPIDRIRCHFRKTDNPQTIINKATNKYGKNNFKIEILVTGFNKDFLNELEIFFIKKYNSIQPNGYNIQSGGHLTTYSEQTKLKMRLKAKHIVKNGSKKGIKFSKEHIENMKKSRKGFDSANRKRARKLNVKIKKLKGDYVKIKAIHIESNKEFTFLTISDCCKELNLDPTCVSRVCRGKDNRTQHKGYRFVTEKYGESLPKKEEPVLKGISKINNGGYSVIIKGKYIGYRKKLEDAIALRDAEKSAKEQAERKDNGTLKRSKK